MMDEDRCTARFLNTIFFPNGNIQDLWVDHHEWRFERGFNDKRQYTNIFYCIYCRKIVEE